MNNTMKRIIALLLSVMLISMISISVFAADEISGETVSAETAENNEVNADNTKGTKAIAAAIVVGIVAAAGAIGMAIAIAKSVEGMARQPEIAGKINSSMMLGLVFIETAIIYALIVAILVIFVL